MLCIRLPRHDNMLNNHNVLFDFSLELEAVFHRINLDGELSGELYTNALCFSFQFIDHYGGCNSQA